MYAGYNLASKMCIFLSVRWTELAAQIYQFFGLWKVFRRRSAGDPVCLPTAASAYDPHRSGPGSFSPDLLGLAGVSRFALLADIHR